MRGVGRVVIVGYLISSFSLQAFKLGVENIPADLMQWLQKHSVALVTNQTGKDQHGQRTVDIFVRNNVPVKTIFVPEHGFTGSVTAGKEVHDAIDAKTSLPIVSLYTQGTGKELTKNRLHNIDTLVFDIQDCGMRHFTYISTLFYLVSAASKWNKRLVVLDRPNPLGCCMEGPLVEDSLRSFRAIAPIPLRHGMTVGELATYFNRHLLKKPAKLYVVPMQGYDRTMKVPNSLVTNLSPNLQSRDACYGYSFLGLLGEVRPFKLGVGTDKAFCSIMLPSKNKFSATNWQEVSTLLAKHSIRTMPDELMHPREKQMHTGVRLIIDDINAVSSTKTFLDVLDLFKQKKVSISFSDYFDRAVGTTKIREFLQGCATKVQLAQYLNKGLHTFYQQVQPLFMYKPYPKVIEL